MAAKNLNILHIDTEKSWRGGQQQVYYLHESLVNQGINSVLVCNKSSELKKKCEAKNLPFLEQSMIGEIDIFSAYQISKFCKKNNINIVHSHSAHAIAIGILVKLFYTKAKLIVVKRVDFPIKKNFLSQLKYNNKRINKIVCISDFIKSVLIKDGIDHQKLLTIRSGVDVNKFKDVNPEEKFRESFGIYRNEFLIGTVAAFAGHKDYPNLIQAFQIVRKKMENVKLCCVGDGPLFEKIKTLANDLKLEKDIVFPGFTNNIGNYLKTFDLFVLASKKEGLGTSIIDAMSVGLPIVATNTGGIPEIIENGKNGILVEPKNPNELANAIVDLINNQDQREMLGKNALQNVFKYSIETTVNKNIELYKKLN
jgi:glycosyltransferase involved in cell wall biosynthesis